MSLQTLIAVLVVVGLLNAAADIVLFTLSIRILRRATTYLDMAALHGKLTDNKEERTREKIENAKGQIIETVLNSNSKADPKSLRAPVMAALVAAAFGPSVL